VSNELWKSARERISLEAPSQGRHDAKLQLSNIFRQFGVGSFSPSECVVGWTGRFEQNKGLRLLPSILQVVCDAGCTLAISGYSTNAKMQKDFELVTLRRLKHISRANACSFFILGTKEDQRLHSMVVRAATDIIIVPSYSEGFGLVAAEALAFGTIPVVSDVGGLPDIIRPLQETDDGVWTGLTFPVFDGKEEETSLSVSNALSLAIETFNHARASNVLGDLQKRIIETTPLRDEGLRQYNALYQLLASRQ
jgi:glycogen synthase